MDSSFLSRDMSQSVMLLIDGANLLVLKTRRAQLRHKVDDRGTISAFGKPIIICTHRMEKAVGKT